MAAIVLTDAYIKIGTIILTDQAASVAISMSAEADELGVMGERNVQRFEGGKLDWSCEIEVLVDEETIGQDLFEMMGDKVDLEIRPSSGAVSATNPSYEGPAILTSYNPLGSGDHGSVVLAQLSFAGAGALTRAVS